MLKHLSVALSIPYGVLGIAFASLAFAQTASAPANLMLATHKSPWEFVMLLATASVPSGIELKERDDTSNRVRPDYSFDQTAKVPVAELLKSFNSQHPDYMATNMDGVIVIRPTDDRIAFLDQPSAVTSRVEITGLMSAVKRIFLPLDPRMSGIAVGSRIGNIDRGEDARIVLTAATNQTTIDSLNQIVRQIPRTWYVISRKVGDQSQIARFGLFHGRGAATNHDVLSRVAK